MICPSIFQNCNESTKSQKRKKVEIFYANHDPDTISRIFSLLKEKRPIALISKREPYLPSPFNSPSNIITCLQTSGTTGEKKFALHTLENHFYSSNFPHPDLTLTPNDCWLLSLPLNHIGGLAILFRASISRSRIGLEGTPNDQITHISFVPTQLKRFLQKKNPYPNLKAILVGGAPIPYSLCLEAYNLGLPLYLTYGMTEMSSQIATKKFHPDQGVSFGSPLPHREIKIDRDNQIWVKGKTLFSGYLNEESKAMEPSPSLDGYFPTKDLGQMTSGGLHLFGRRDNMIISGGENIHLEEIEKALLTLPFIVSVSMSSRADDEFGERPTAHLQTSVEISIRAIRERLFDDLPRYKIPNVTDITVSVSTSPTLN